jgi:hypothetical protein
MGVHDSTALDWRQRNGPAAEGMPHVFVRRSSLPLARIVNDNGASLQLIRNDGISQNASNCLTPGVCTLHGHNTCDTALAIVPEQS